MKHIYISDEYIPNFSIQSDKILFGKITMHDIKNAIMLTANTGSTGKHIYILKTKVIIKETKLIMKPATLY